MYRPQFPFPPAPPGFIWQPCVYQFDSSNLPYLGAIALTSGQESGYIPLDLDYDAPFYLHAVKVQSSGTLKVKLWDPDYNELLDDYVAPAEWGTSVPPLAILEGGDGIRAEAGAKFALRLKGV